MITKNQIWKMILSEKQSLKSEVWNNMKLLETYEIPKHYLEFVKAKPSKDFNSYIVVYWSHNWMIRNV